MNHSRILFSSVNIVIKKTDLRDWKKWRATVGDGYTLISFEQSFIKLKKFVYPQQFFLESLDGFEIGYVLSKDDRFAVSLSNDILYITTPSCGQLSLFYFETSTHFFAADTFDNLISLIPKALLPDLDFLGIIDYLMARFEFDKHTILDGVRMLTENKMMVLNSGSLKIEQHRRVRDLLKMYPKFDSDSSCLQGLYSLISQQLENVVHTAESEIAFGSTLSGGVDSAIISFIAKDRGLVKHFSLIQPDENAPLQQSRLDTLKDILRGQHTRLEIEHIPLLDTEDWASYIDPYTEIYNHLFARLADAAVDQGVTTILTGIGGDDFFTVTQSKKRRTKDEASIAKLFSDRSKQIIAKLGTWKSEKPSSVVLWAGAEGYHFFSQVWRKRGIWGVAPFFSNEIVSLSLQIPDKLKQKKELLKQFASEIIGMPELKDGAKDSFSHYFESSLCDFLKRDGYILLSKSALFSFDLLDFEQLEALIKKIVAGESVLKSELLMIYLVIRLELFIKAYQVFLQKDEHV